jgi:hypothetical protein
MDESEPDYTPGNDELNLVINFRTDLLDEDNQFEVPLFFVNREAHSIALAWFHEQVHSLEDCQLRIRLG